MAPPRLHPGFCFWVYCPVGFGLGEGEGRLQSKLCYAVISVSVWLLCDPMDCSLLGSSAHRILQARVLEWVAMPSSRDLPDPGIQPMSLMSPALTTWVLYH